MKSWLLLLVLWSSLAVVKPALAEPTPSPKALWLLLHGIWPGAGRDWRLVAPLLQERGATVWQPNLPARAGLFAWAENIVGHLEAAPTKLYVVAHSFSGAATLFLLRTAYELQHGRLETLIERLACESFTGRAAYACRQIQEGWQQLLADSERAAHWIGAAKKIGRVFLYHPALRGACGACWDIWGIGGGDTTASLCLLEIVADRLFSPIERVTWDGAIAVINLYGGSAWMISLCGVQSNDFALQLAQQRLGAAYQHSNYREVFVGTHMHFAFALRRSVAQRLVEQLEIFVREKEVSNEFLRR